MIHIQYVESGLLRPADYNPRQWDDSLKQKLRASIEKFGFVDPLIVNEAKGRKNIIIGGHFRWEIAKELGLEKVPVVFLNIPDPEKEKELNLRLNRNTGDWNLELLKAFDLDLLLEVGFDESDLSKVWDDLLQTEDDAFDVTKALKEAQKPKAKLGDVYQLGRHRLICGDSTDSDVVKKLVAEAKINMVYCDSPYNIKLDYDKGIGGSKNYGGKTTNDAKSDQDYREFLKKTIQNALSIACEDLHVFYWCDENYIGMVQSLFQELGLVNRRVCLWVKNNQNATPQIAFNKVYEPCVYATRGKPYLAKDHTKYNEILNKEIETGNRSLDDILDLFNIWLCKRLPTTEYRHPTEKPVTLHEKALRRCSKVGDKVLDLFGGSGSTLIACEQLKRTCYMVEIEPAFIDVIIQRYEKLTGQKAKKLH